VWGFKNIKYILDLGERLKMCNICAYSEILDQSFYSVKKKVIRNA
jgi:hypothetical protein